MDFKQALSDFAKGFQLKDTPEDVIARSKLILLDSLTAIISGNQLDHLKELQDETALKNEDVTPGTRIYGTRHKAPAHLAAMINGIAMVSEEMDEGNPLAKGHPSCHFLPALLAIAEEKKVSGSTFLESFIVGYEVGARAGSAINLRGEIHPHGNWGMIGSSFAVGKLSGYTKEQYIAGVDLSTSFSAVSLWQPVLEGHRIRDIHIGMNNLHATLVPSFTRSGFTSSPSTIESLYDGGILGTAFDRAKMTEKIGREYYLKKTYFKFYAFCRFCHSPIDATEALIEENDLQADAIERIDVHTYSLAAKLSGQEVANEYAGKFSIPVAVASSFYKEGSEEEVAALAKQVFVYEDPELTKLLPNERNTRLEVTLKNGKTLSSFASGATGDATDENLEQNVIEKCRQHLAGAIGRDAADRLIDQILHIESSEDTRFIAEIISPK